MRIYLLFLFFKTLFIYRNHTMSFVQTVSNNLAAGVVVVATKDGQVAVPAGKVNMLTHTPQRVELPPTQTPTGNWLLSADNKITTLISPGIANYMYNLMDRISLSESGGSSSVAPTKVWSFFNKIEIRQRNAQEILQTIPSFAMFCSSMLWSDEKWQQVAPLHNTTSTWGLQPAIAASGTRDVYMMYLGCVLEVLQPYLQGIKADIEITRYTNTTSKSSGSGTLNLAGVNLCFDTDKLHAHDEKDAQLHSGSKEPGSIPQADIYLDYNLQEGTGTFTASTETKVSLKGLQGKCPFMLIGLKSSNSNTAEGKTSYAALENSSNDGGKIDLLDNAGKSLFTHGATYFAANARKMTFAKHFNSKFADHVAVYLIPFCDNASKAWIYPSLGQGFQQFTGSDLNLSITPSASWTSGSYFYDILVPYFKEARVNGGLISGKMI
jgi:hypothetical protein